MNDTETILSNLIDTKKGWESLTAKEWIVLLCCSKEFAAKCNKVNGWASFDGQHWLHLLKTNKYFNEFVKHDGFSKLDNSCWVTLIIEQPEMASKYRYKIHDYDELWQKILHSLSHFGAGWKFFDNSDWLRLLKIQPRYIGKCDEFNGWDKLTIWNVIELFKSAPLYIDIFPLWSKFDAKNWVFLLDELPQLADKCDMVNGWKNFGTMSWDPQDCYNNEENCWVYILIVHPEFADRCDKINGWSEFTANDWVKLLTEKKQFEDKCDRADGWGRFKSHHWVNLLKVHPLLSVKCDACGRWQDFNGFDWVSLLRAQPALSNKCDSFDGWRKIDFTATSICRNATSIYRKDYMTHGMIVDDKGIFVNVARIECPDKNHYSCRRNIQPQDENEGYVCYDVKNQLVAHLKTMPMFCGRWAELLECQPQFAAKCDEFNGWVTFDGFDWFRLLSAQPHFVRKCNELNAWQTLFYFRPKTYHRSEYEEDGGYGGDINWNEYAHELLCTIPAEYEEEFSRERILPADQCCSGLPVDCWLCGGKRKSDCIAESRQEQIIPTDEEISKVLTILDKSFWVYFLNQNPVLALSIVSQHNRGDIWETFTIDDWKTAIKNRIWFVNHTTNFDSKDDLEYNPQEDFFDSKFWNALIASWPDFLDNLKYWYEVSRDEGRMVECETWPYLIRHRPDWTIHMSGDNWNKFDKQNWERLLHPHWQYLAKTTVTPDNNFWRNCLSKLPQFAETCEKHGGWSKLSNNHLCDLMSEHIELISYCVKYLKWDELSCNNWITMITNPKFGGDFVRECDRHNGWIKFIERKYERSCIGWVELLKDSPQFADKCSAMNGWKQFNGTEWQTLLSAQPQLINFCDDNNGWHLFNEENWMWLIDQQPSFVGKYAEKYQTCEVNKLTPSEIVEKAKEFVRLENRKRFLRENDWQDDYYDYLPRTFEDAYEIYGSRLWDA